MNKIKLISIGLSISILFSSCGAKKKVKSPNTSRRTHKTEKNSETQKRSTKTKKVSKNTTFKARVSTLEYIEEYAHIATKQMKVHNIPASITLAQGILESNSGNSGLTKNSNNHFGIKCHKNWKGLRTYYDDDAKGECFRVYKDPANSFQDHALFLTQRSRYEGLFKLGISDYKAWAEGLSKAGYATDKKYPQKLIRIIENYELYKYDELVLGKEIQPIETVSDVSGKIVQESSYYIVKKGDGLYGIARKFGLKVTTLKKFNDLKSNSIFPGQKLYLKPVVNQQVVNKEVDKNDVKEKLVATKIDSIPPKKEVATTKTVSDIAEVVKVQIDTIPPINEIDTTRLEVKNPIPEVVQDFHIVKEKETLYKIAYMYNLEIPDIRRWNGIKKDEIKIGQKIFLKKQSSQSKPIIPGNKNHTVIKGDTLFSIARKYGMTVSELKNINNLQEDTISIDQILSIK